MSIEAYRELLISSVKAGTISARTASRMFNKFLEKRLTKQK